MKRRTPIWMTTLIVGLAGPAAASGPDEVQTTLARRLDARIEARVEPALRGALRQPVDGVMAWVRAQTESRMRCHQPTAARAECLIALRPPRASASGAPARLGRGH